MVDIIIIVSLRRSLTAESLQEPHGDDAWNSKTLATSVMLRVLSGTTSG